MKVGVTGAGGFVGSGVIKELLADGHDVHAFSSQVNICAYNAINLKYYSYSEFLEGKLSYKIVDLDVMIIAHGIAHTRNNKDLDSAYKINYEDVLNIAEICRTLNIKKFIFISSANVSEKLNDKAKFSSQKNDNDLLMSLKHNVTQDLFNRFGNDYQIIILQPVLMYGTQMKGSLSTLRKIIKLRIPLPIRRIDSARCYLSLRSLGRLICQCIKCDLNQREVFVVSDENPITIMQLTDALSDKATPNLYFFMWPSILRCALSLIGKSDIAEHLYKDLVTDLSQVKLKTGWQPVADTVQAIKDET